MKSIKTLTIKVLVGFPSFDLFSVILVLVEYLTMLGFALTRVGGLVNIATH